MSVKFISHGRPVFVAELSNPQQVNYWMLSTEDDHFSIGKSACMNDAVYAMSAVY